MTSTGRDFEERYEKAFGSISLSPSPGSPGERAARTRQVEKAQTRRLESVFSPEYRPNQATSKIQSQRRLSGATSRSSNSPGGNEKQKLQGIEQDAWEKYQRYEEILSPTQSAPKSAPPPKANSAPRRGYAAR